MDLQDLPSRPADPRLLCHFEEHTADHEDNQILLAAVRAVLRSGICSGQAYNEVLRAARILRGTVSERIFHPSEILDRSYTRLNQDYRGLHPLCHFLLSHTGPADYTVALAVDGGALRVHRRRGTKWERLKDGKLPGIVGKKRIRFEAVREGGTVRLRIDGSDAGEFGLPGRALGLALQGGEAEFSEVAWE